MTKRNELNSDPEFRALVNLSAVLGADPLRVQGAGGEHLDQPRRRRERIVGARMAAPMSEDACDGVARLLLERAAFRRASNSMTQRYREV
jgi:hypothetical protein